LTDWDWPGAGGVPADVYDVSSSPNGDHWIGAFSDPAFGKLYDASGDYITPVVYVVVDGVEHALNIDCVTNDLIADPDANFSAGAIALSRTILSRVRINPSGNIYRDQDKLAISDSGNWAACLMSTGFAVSDTSTCTTNIVHVINGVVFEHVERVFNPSGVASSYVANVVDYLALCRAYISPDDEIALIVAPTYANRNLGNNISTTDPGFFNNVVDGDVEIFIYSLSTNSLITSHIYGIDSDVNIACVARTSNRTELLKTVTGYRLERIDNGYFAVDITVTEEEGGGKTYTFSETGQNFVVSNGDGALGPNGDAESRTTSIYDGTIHRPVTKIR
jgi:hypothetical protein